MARRAASIWRAVRRPRPTALRPKSPKLTLAPRVARPVLRPFCSLRNFLLAGCSMFHSWFLAALFLFGHRRLLSTAERVALVHPYLATDDAVGGFRFGKAIINDSAQGMQRHTDFAIPFGTGDRRAVQTSGTHDLDALRTQAHGILHGTLHGATEHHALFKLLGNADRNDLAIGLGLAHFFDIDVHGHRHQARQLTAQHLDVLAFFAN